MDAFTSYGWTHGLIVAISIAAWVYLIRFARVSRGTAREAVLRRALAVSILTVEGIWFAWKMTPSEWNVDQSLPFHLCDFAWMACAWSLMTAGAPNRLLHQVVILWTLGLAILGYLTPTIDVPPTDPRFWQFWLIHWMVLGTGLLNLAAFGTVVDWKGCRGTIIVSAALFIPVTIFNLIFETPYFFSGKGTPENPTPIDLLGEWPLRLVWMILLVIAWLHLLALVLRSRPVRRLAGTSPPD